MRQLIRVRHFTQSDAAQFATLMVELLQHYGMASTDVGQVCLTVQKLFGKVNFLLAFDGDALIGFASYAILFPGEGLAPQLYMKDLYTKATHRGRGVARAIFQALAKEAKAQGCVRVDWTTESDNHSAQAAYEALGAKILTEKIYYRLDAHDIARLSGGDDDQA